MGRERERQFFELQLRLPMGGFSGKCCGGTLAARNTRAAMLRCSLTFPLLFIFLLNSTSAVTLRVGFRADPEALTNPEPSAEQSSVAILENGEIVEMRARTFEAVRQWCLAYQEQWQTYNNLCLNDELSSDYRRAAAAGGEAIAQYREYTGLQPTLGQSATTRTASEGRAEVRPVDDPNTRTHAAKYIYGTVCTGVLNYACRKILETSVVKADTDTVAVPTSTEVDKMLEDFNKQTPEAAGTEEAVAEKLMALAASPETGKQEPPQPEGESPGAAEGTAEAAPPEEGPAKTLTESQGPQAVPSGDAETSAPTEMEGAGEGSKGPLPEEASQNAPGEQSAAISPAASEEGPALATAPAP